MTSATCSTLCCTFFQSKVNIFSLWEQIASREESTLAETLSRYVILLSLHHSPFQTLSCFIVPLFFFSQPLHGDVMMPLLIYLFPLYFILYPLFPVCSVWYRLYLTFVSFLPIFVSLVAGNEYLIYSLSPLSDGL